MLDVHAVRGCRQDAMSGRGRGLAIGQVHRDGGDVTVQTHRLEESVGHDELPCPARVDAVLARDHVVVAVAPLGHACIQHRYASAVLLGAQ